MRKWLLLPAILLLFCLTGCGDSKDVTTLNVYNWGQYISDGPEDSVNVNEEFEIYCREELGKEVRVNYTTYASNEDMYNKIRSGSASYDVVIPSEYMIERMIAEGMLQKLDFSNIPNYVYVSDEFKNLFHDPNNEYSVPYTYGMVGVIYNETMVDEEDVGSWDLLWNEKYKGRILQFNNPRDAFGTAMYAMGADVNTKDEAVWQEAAERLKKQKPLIQSYVMDEIFNKMKNGSAAIAPYYAGDFLTMYEANENLRFYYPKEGTNVFVDAMCVPLCARNKELAEQYINFMLSDDIALANAEYIAYSCPHTNVTGNEDYVADMLDWNEDVLDILYPAEQDYPTSYYESLDNETMALQNSLWEDLKIENATEPWIYITSGSIVLLLVCVLFYQYLIKKIRNRY